MAAAGQDAQGGGQEQDDAPRVGGFQQAPGRVVRYDPLRDGALPPHRHLPRDSARLRQLPQARGGAADA